ncbi:hypothetical protein OROMI_022807 [Orobanche minor]
MTNWSRTGGDLIGNEPCSGTDELVRDSQEMGRSGSEAGPSSDRVDFGDPVFYPAVNHGTLLTEEEVAKFAEDYDIPTDVWHTYHPRKKDRIHHNPSVPDSYGGIAVGISEAALKCGFRVPMLPLTKTLFGHMGIALGQMDPNGFLHINGFQCHWLAARVKPSSELFWYHYDFRRNPKSVGFYSIARRGGRTSWVQTNSNNRGSHDRWFFLSGPDISRFSQWSLSDPHQIVATELDGLQRRAYKKLCEVDMGRKMGF